MSRKLLKSVPADALMIATAALGVYCFGVYTAARNLNTVDYHPGARDRILAKLEGEFKGPTEV